MIGNAIKSAQNLSHNNLEPCFLVWAFVSPEPAATLHFGPLGLAVAGPSSLKNFPLNTVAL